MQLTRPTALPIDHWTKPDVGYSTMRVTSPFGWRSYGGRLVFHGGLDIGNARLGDQVIAAAPGRVLAVGNLGKPWSEPTSRFPSGNYGGLMVVVDHGAGIVSVYAHLRDAKVEAGAAVSRGQLLGHVGESGSAAPPPLGGGGHLHFTVQAPLEVIPDGVAHRASAYGLGGHDVDPWPLITGIELGSRLQRLELERGRLRQAKPRQAALWRSATGITEAAVGKPLRAASAAAGEVLFLRRTTE